LFKRKSFTRIYNENISQQIFSFLVFKAFGKIEFSLWYSVVSLLKPACFEGSLAYQHQIHNDTCTPDIDLIWMARMSHAHTVHDYLRGNIIRGTTYSVFPVSWKLNFSGQSKICKLELHLTIDQKITQFNAA
jgi:hypothetical protein